MSEERLRRALAAIDAANGGDPHTIGKWRSGMTPPRDSKPAKAAA